MIQALLPPWPTYLASARVGLEAMVLEQSALLTASKLP